MPADVEARLDQATVRDVAEYLARRLHLHRGSTDIQLRFDNGALRRTDIHLGPVRNAELEHLPGR